MHPFREKLRTMVALNWARPAHLLLAAALLHILTTIAVFTVGRLAVAPGSFDENGVGQFAFDSIRYREEALSLVQLLREGGLSAWVDAAPEMHVKAYSLSYLIFGPVLGHSILGVEPLNLFYYLAIVSLVYGVGAQVFGRRAGLLAAALVALWPSFLLHTTQLLKDPLSVACLLAIVLVAVTWLGSSLTPARAVLMAAAYAAPLFVLARVKSNMWESVASVVLTGAALLLLRCVRERRALVGNLLCAALALILLFAAPVRTTTVTVRDTNAVVATGEQGFVWGHLGARIASRRAYFIERYSGAFGSNIDEGVTFRNTADIVRYLPRATLVGFFAPFPSMWLARGAYTGRAGRLLSGAEMLACYLVAALACVGMWRGRRNAAAWLLFVVTLVNMVALGLVVTNVGALFRLRYVFWMLIIVLAAEGAAHFFIIHPPSNSEAISAGHKGAQPGTDGA